MSISTFAKSVLKSEIKGNTVVAQTLRREENRSLNQGRFLRVIGSREEDASEEQKKDFSDSEEFYNLYQNLRHRRVNQLRRIQRANFLAYAFLRGKGYSTVETHDDVHERPNFDLVERIVFRDIDPEETDPRSIKQRFEQWVQEAKGVS